MTQHGPDRATENIETLWAGRDKTFFINTNNAGRDALPYIWLK